MTTLRPGVSVQEFDIPYYVPHFTSEIALFCGNFEKGPIDVPVFITSIDDFKFIFGRGIDFHRNDWYQVFNYLQYASGIWVIRTAGTKRYNASNEEPILLNIKEDFYNTIIPTASVRIIARTPGIWGNLLKVAIIQKEDWDNNVTIYGDYTAKQVFKKFTQDNYGICVFRKDTLVEAHYLSEAKMNTVNEDSLYIYLKYNVLDSYFGDNIIQLSGGLTSLPSDLDIQTSYDIFSSIDDYDVDIVIGNDLYNMAAVNLAESRKDCIAFIGIPPMFMTVIKAMFGPISLVDSKPYETVYSEQGPLIVLNVLRFPKKLKDQHYKALDDYIETITKSQFVHFSLNIKEQYDGFTGTNIMVNIAGDTAGLKAQASLKRPWNVGAGLERGAIKNANQIFLLMNDNKTAEYYDKGLNYVQNGYLMTQRTFWDGDSSFNRVNVRSLFNYVEKTARKLMRKYVFDFNDVQMRSKVTTELKRLLTDVKSNKGIEDAFIETHPKGNHGVVIDVYIKPKYVAEYIILRLKNVGQNVISNIIEAEG